MKKTGMSSPFTHILICRTDNIGDVVLTLPLAGYLKNTYPDLRIDFLCRAYAAPVVRLCAAIDRVITLEDVDGAENGAAAFLAQCGADTIIFGFPNRRLAQAAKKAKIKNRVGTSHRFFHWLYCNKLAHFSRVNSPLHEAQLNFALLKPLGIKLIPTPAEIASHYGLSAAAASGDGEIHALLANKRFNLILHPKSNGNGREWPLAHYTELARLLQEQDDIQIWITGSAAEGAALAQTAGDLLRMPNVQNCCGKFDLRGLCALIAGCDGLIASGTGPLHIAAALGKRALGLFPPLKPIDPARWGALGLQAQNLSRDEACKGCVDAANCACMQGIAPSQVTRIVLDWRIGDANGNGDLETPGQSK